VLLPTINDNFTGRAPDLGAVELNQPELTMVPAGSPGRPSIVRLRKPDYLTIGSGIACSSARGSEAV
jgi:hypothetical protein